MQHFDIAGFKLSMDDTTAQYVCWMTLTCFLLLCVDASFVLLQTSF